MGNKLFNAPEQVPLIANLHYHTKRKAPDARHPHSQKQLHPPRLALARQRALLLPRMAKIVVPGYVVPVFMSVVFVHGVV